VEDEKSEISDNSAEVVDDIVNTENTDESDEVVVKHKKPEVDNYPEEPIHKVAEENSDQKSDRPAYAEPLEKQEVVKAPASSPGVIVLQWVTYALWGWTVVAVAFLVAAILAFHMISADIGDQVMYGVAAVVILLPSAAVCDIFYSKHEPVKKSGVSSAVMIIHAVIFTLMTIGTVITAAFSLVTLLIVSSSTEGILITMYTALIVALLLILVLLRTIMPKKLFAFRRYFIIFMIFVVSVIVFFGIIGPIADARLTRNDKLIEQELSSVSYAIDSYVETNSKLPNSLTDLELTGNTKKLVSDNLVDYTKESQYGKMIYDEYSSSTMTYYYKLCVDYQRESKDDYYSGYSSSYDNADDDGYSTSPDTYHHVKGEVCYKLKSEDYNNRYYEDPTPIEIQPDTTN